jgi:hypothetical protein
VGAEMGTHILVTILVYIRPPFPTYSISPRSEQLARKKQYGQTLQAYHGYIGKTAPLQQV